MTLKHSLLALALAAGIGLALTGCGSDDEQTTDETAATGTAAEAAPAAVPAATTAVPPPPELKARSFIVIDHDSGRVLAALEPDSRQEPASLTKLMTAYAVFKALKEGRIKTGDMVTISERAWKQEGSRMFVEVGKQVSVNDLLQGMIVQSGNDATVALAEKVGGTEETFVQMMNTYAKQLGMTNSHFTNSPGMPGPEHYMTARDAATLASALIHEFPEYYKLYAQREFGWNGITQQNRNGLLWRDPTVDGVKTGHTETAGYCLIASAKREGMRLVSVVLGTDSMRAREDASAALLNYGFNFFETKRVYAAGQPLTTARVWKGKDEVVGLALKRDLYVTSQRGRVGSVKAEFELPETLEAPLSQNKAIGKTRIVVDGAPVAAYDLYPAKDVVQAGFFGRTWDSLRLMFH
ncbi:MAG TPA: D-alanyl-D-alanine carboxypeptidase family protein [Steroidobacteraceae bacterium]